MSHFPPDILCQTSTVADGNMSFRFGEVAEVVENRRRFLSENGVDFAKHLCMACDNGETILAVDSSHQGVGGTTQASMPTAEVLFTCETNFALMLLTADCIPASFYDPVQQVIALAHFNRHTIAHTLAEKTVGWFREHYHSNPEDILVHFGAHIQTTSYSFSLPLDNNPPTELQDFVMKQGAEVIIDLKGAFTHQLTQTGIQKKNIAVSDSDTATSDRCFSHYRSKHDPSHPTGRLATILMLRQ